MVNRDIIEPIYQENSISKTSFAFCPKCKSTLHYKQIDGMRLINKNDFYDIYCPVCDCMYYERKKNAT